MMGDSTNLARLEVEAYRASFRDGIYDLFFGLSVLWYGAAWLWLPDLAGLAQILPAALVVPLMEMRKRIVEPRAGYVRWSERRRRAERGRSRGLVALGVATFGLVVAVATLAARSGGGTGDLVAALPASLLALIAFVLALASGLWRAFAYGSVLLAAGIITVARGADPGMDMLVAGAIITVWAGTLVVTFLGRTRGRRA